MSNSQLMEFKDWQIPIVKLLLTDKYTENNPLRSREAWYHTMEAGSEIGRSSVQVFMKSLAEAGLVNSRKQAARGGYHGVYWASQSLKEMKE